MDTPDQSPDDPQPVIPVDRDVLASIPASPFAQEIPPPGPPKDPRPHPHFGWALLWTFGLLVMQLAAGIALMIPIVAYALSEGTPPDELEAFAKRFQSYLLVGGTALTLTLSIVAPLVLFRRDFFTRLGFRRFTALQFVIVVLFTIPHAVVVGEIGNWAAEVLPTDGLEAFSDFSMESWILVFIGGCIFPAVGEEIFFRGILSRGLVGYHGVVLGSIGASLLFALMHVLPVQVCVTFFAGLSIQAVFLLTHSLNASILLHLLNNTFAFGMMKYGELLPIDGVTVSEPDAPSHTPWLILTTAILACAALFALLTQTRTRWRTPSGKEWNPGFTPTETPPTETGAAAENDSPRWYLLLAVCAAYGSFIAAVYYSLV